MTIENAIRLLAETLVLISITLSVLVNQWWLLLGVFVGANLIQSVFTGILSGGNDSKKNRHRVGNFRVLRMCKMSKAFYAVTVRERGGSSYACNY